MSEQESLQIVLNSLQQKIDKKKPKPVPAFLNKLVTMLDTELNHIQWAGDGMSFIVTNQAEFCKNVLPKYFKHNNFTSFIRQLNMYGFHKIPSTTNEQNMEFKHDFFNKFNQDFEKITRRKTEESAVQFGLKDILVELQHIKRQQQLINTEILQMKKENYQVWQQQHSLQQECDKQKETIDKILGFLAKVFSKKDLVGEGNGLNGIIENMNTRVDHSQKRRRLIEEAANNASLKSSEYLNGTQPIPFAPKSFDLFSIDPVQTTTTTVGFPISDISQLFPKSDEADTTKPNLNEQSDTTEPPEKIFSNSQLFSVEQDIDLLQDRIFDITNNINDMKDEEDMFHKNDKNKELDFDDFFDVGENS
jgi:hypothetical protein